MGPNFTFQSYRQVNFSLMGQTFFSLPDITFCVNSGLVYSQGLSPADEISGNKSTFCLVFWLKTLNRLLLGIVCLNHWIALFNLGHIFNKLVLLELPLLPGTNELD